MYKYFIAYQVSNQNGKTSAGNCECNIKNKISSFEQLKAIKEKLKEENLFENVIITNFILLEGD